MAAKKKRKASSKLRTSKRAKKKTSKKKTRAKGKIPLKILQKRLIRLSNIVKARS